jgi:hypothetical protein
MVQYLRFKTLTSRTSPDLRKTSEVFTLVQSSEVDHINYYRAYYSISITYQKDRNKQSKITVHETDILNSYFTELEHLYRHYHAASRL